MTFPYYVVSLETLFALDRVQPHEQLLEEGLLVDFDSSMGRSGFISHQWVSVHHPDPEFAQMRIFQQALRRMLTPGSRIYADIATEYNTKGDTVDLEEMRSKPLFFWPPGA